MIAGQTFRGIAPAGGFKLGIPKPNALIVPSRGAINYGSKPTTIVPVIAGAVFFEKSGGLPRVNKNTTSSADYLSLGTSTDICTSPFTWLIQVQVNSTNVMELVESAVNAVNQSAELQYSTNQLSLNLSNVVAIVTSTAVIGLNQWHTVAVTYDGTVGTIIIDGKVNASRSDPRTFTHGTFGIGGGRNGTSFDQPNRIALFAMWPYVLRNAVLCRLTNRPWAHLSPFINDFEVFGVAAAGGGGGIVGPLIGARHLFGGGALIGGRLAFDRHERGVHA